MLYASRFGTLDAVAGTGIELAAVSAVVVGGVAIFGGSGTVWGAALGALLLATIRSALVILQVDPFWDQADQRRPAAAAIGLDAYLAMRLARELRKRRSCATVSDVKHAPARWETVTVFLLLVAILYGGRPTSGEDFLSGGNLTRSSRTSRRSRSSRSR